MSWTRGVKILIWFGSTTAVAVLWCLGVGWAARGIAGGIYPLRWGVWDHLVNLVDRFPLRRRR